MGLKLNTIYPAFMGEVNHYGIGAKCTFLRLNGCNMRCYLYTKGVACDTPEALVIGEGIDSSVAEILERVAKLGNRIVCLTGGEPLHQKPVLLLEALSANGFEVVVETNGSQLIAPYRHIPGVSYIIDYKTGSTGEGASFRDENLSLMDERDFVKFVVDDWDDYNEMVSFANRIEQHVINVSVGLFWGSKIGYKELCDRIISDNLNVSINMQTHKMMMMYDTYKDEVDKINIPREL